LNTGRVIVKQLTRAATIGCGVISGEHLPFLQSQEDIALVGVCDLSPAIADYTANRFGTAAFTDVATMLAGVRPDVVHVLTPPLTHPRLVRMALDAGCHVLCEKPLTATLAETRDLLAHASSIDRILVESQNYRFNDQMLEIDKLVAAGRLGEIVGVEVSTSLDLASGRLVDPNLPSPVAGLPGGALHDFLPHEVYLALQLLGFAAPVKISAHWRNNSGLERVKYDEMNAIVTFDTGAFAHFSISSRAQPDSFRLTVRGTVGVAEVEFFQPYVRVEVGRGRPKLSGVVNTAVGGGALLAGSVRNLRDKVLRHTPYHGMHRMLREVYDAVGTSRPSPIAPRDIEATAVLVDALIAGAAS
jgi:predicted dehydrogenase